MVPVGNALGVQNKKFKIKASQITRTPLSRFPQDAYLSYAAVTRDAAQRRYWAFYEAISFKYTMDGIC